MINCKDFVEKVYLKPGFSGNSVTSSITAPGITSTVLTATVSAYAGPASTVPIGYLLCDGTVYQISQYPVLAQILGNTYGGDGVTTFAVPDLKGRMVIGLNQSSNDGSIRVWSSDNFSNNQAIATSYNVNSLGGISGEEKHRQTLTELAPHHHLYTNAWGSGTTGRGPDGSASAAPTTETGGNGDGSGLGAGANIIPPVETLNYIIKT